MFFTFNKVFWIEDFFSIQWVFFLFKRVTLTPRANLIFIELKKNAFPFKKINE